MKLRLKAVMSAVSAVAIAAMSLTGCSGSQTTSPAADGGKPSGEITFQTWSLKGDKFSPYFEKLIADFEKANPGTKIHWIDQPGDGYEDKVLQQANSGQLPDVINLPPEFAFQLAKAGKLADLNKIDADNLKTFVEGGLKGYQYDGLDGTYGYPWYLGTDVNWWNTKAMKEAGVDPSKLPTTFDEFYETAKTMAEKSGGKMPLVSSAPGFDVFASNGVEVFKDGKFIFNSPEAVAIVQKYADLYKMKAMPPETLNNDYAGNTKLYQQGKVAWTTATASFVTELEKNAPSLLPDTVATKRIGNPPLFIQGISIAAESKNPTLAKAFASFVVNNANQVEFVKLAQGFMPGTKEANDHPESFTASYTSKLLADAVKIAASQMPDAKPLQPAQYTNAMDKYVKQQIALALKGDITPQEALDKGVKYCNENILK